MYKLAFKPLATAQNLKATNNLNKFHTSAFNMIKLTQSFK